MSKSLVCDKDYIENLRGQFILLDNTYLIDLSKDDDDELLNFLNLLKQNDCVITTIMDVFQEFVRGSKTTTQYDQCLKLFRDIIGNKLVSETKSKESSAFVVAYNNLAKHASLTDTKLAMCLYKNKERNDIKLLTANYEDMPKGLLKRESIIAYDTGNIIRTHGFYALQPPEILDKTLSKFDN